MRKMSSRRGFTLPEVLVTVTIVAVLAAVMVPAVINQVAKGDKPAVAEDFGAIRTAITTFAADTRHYPRNFDQLTQSTLAAADSDVVGSTSLFGADAAAAFKGPYLPTSAGPHIGVTGGFYRDRFVLNGSLVCMADSSVAGVSSVSKNVVYQADSALDNASGKLAGVVTWTETAGVPDAGTLKICLVAK